jgi:hypothetical protein
MQISPSLCSAWGHEWRAYDLAARMRMCVSQCMLGQTDTPASNTALVAVHVELLTVSGVIQLMFCIVAVCS